MISAKHQKLSDRIQKERGCKRSSARVYSSNLSRIHREFLSHTKYAQDLKWLDANHKPLLKKLKKSSIPILILNTIEFSQKRHNAFE